MGHRESLPGILHGLCRGHVPGTRGPGDISRWGGLSYRLPELGVQERSDFCHPRWPTVQLHRVEDLLMPRETQRFLEAITRQVKEVTEQSLMPGEAISLTPDGKFCRVRLTGSSRMVKAQM